MKELRDRRLDGIKGLLEFRAAANESCWKASRDSMVLDELHGCGRTAQWNIPVDRDTPVDSYWRVLNAYTAVSTHYIGGFNGAAVSDQMTAFTFQRAGLNPAAMMSDAERGLTNV